MNRYEILDFHELYIEHANRVTDPFDKASFKEDESHKILFVRDPYEYFDALLFDHLFEEKSLLFTQDIIYHMKKLEGEEFLHWFDKLNYMPLHNPQTFQLDGRKRMDVALANLESFDYVVPYDEMDLFLEHVAPDVLIEKLETQQLVFSLAHHREHDITEKWVGKDLSLYDRTKELWEISKKNDYKPLGSLIERKKITKEKKKVTKPAKPKTYKGVAGRIDENSVRGWAFYTEKDETATIGIFKHGKLLKEAKADIYRPDLESIHPNVECGFEVVFDEPVFERGDRVEVKILPEGLPLPLGKNALEFLES